MEYVVKVGRLGNKATVDAIAVEAGKRTSFDIDPNEYISGSSLPSTPFPSDGSLETAQHTLQDIFISPARLADLGSLLKLQIIQKLAPGISKEGYDEEPTEESSTRRAPSPRPPRDIPQPHPDPQPARPYPFNDPLAAQPRRPYVPPGMEPPGFEDEYDIMRPPGRSGPPAGPRNPLTIGDQDLYPPGLGPHDPIRPHFGGGGALPRPGGGAGGMHPSFDDPLFGGQGGGGRGDDPLAPPGARYDPTGPSDPRSGMGFPGAGHRGPGGGPPNPFGGFGGGDFV